MAHHNSTPATVLNAPHFRPQTVSAQHGYSRTERRHGVYSPPSMTPEAKAAAAAIADEVGRNVPATSAKVRKVRRGRKARFNAVSA